jgi:hypothetical protein
MMMPVPTADACTATDDDDNDDAISFWASFLDLCNAGPDLLGLVCQHLTRAEQHALRGVNCAMRRAMNATVTCITCGEATLPTHDLLAVFPNASKLVLESADAALFQQVASGNARLLARVHHLIIDTCTQLIEAADFLPAMLAMLSR